MTHREPRLLRRKEAAVNVQNTFANWLRLGCNGSLKLDILLPPSTGLNGNGREAITAQIVGAGAHIDLAGCPRQVEGIGDNIRRTERRDLVREAIEIHVRMDTAGLIVFGCGSPREFPAVERNCRGSEKTERVVVRTAQRLRIDHGVDFVARKSEDRKSTRLNSS